MRILFVVVLTLINHCRSAFTAFFFLLFVCMWPGIYEDRKLFSSVNNAN
jgi:hypothetical protein